jgi:vacuolar iron transporter family protein
MSGRFIHSEKVHGGTKAKYLSDFVYGANDGIITTFAIVAGAVGAAFSSGIIIVLGLANLLADGISMGLSNYLALKSEKEYQAKQRKVEEDEVDRFPDLERDEVREILEKWAVPADVMPKVLDAITSDKKRWVDFMMREELHLLEDPTDSPMKHGFATFVAFLIAGAMPLIPYVFGVSVDLLFPISIIATGISLFVVGSLRTLVTGVNWITSGLKMLGVGGLAAVAAYGVGYIVRVGLGVTI